MLEIHILSARSLIGFQDDPPVLDFQSPPLVLPTYIMLAVFLSTKIARVLPLKLSGPRLVHAKFIALFDLLVLLFF